MAPQISLEGRRMRPAALDGSGEVSSETVFEFHQDGDMVWALYSGGSIRFGCLVGTLKGRKLDFRYAQLNTDGETATGRSRDRVQPLPDGRLLLHETWAWESRHGEGTSVLEEESAP